MPLESSKFNLNDVQVIAKKTLFQGFFRMIEVTLKHKLFRGGWSREIRREIFFRGDAAAAILYDPKCDTVGLIEQFRIGALDSEQGPWCLETVAGMMDKEETPAALIKRELKEEAGIEEATLIPISRYYSTPGGCDEAIHLYCAVCDLTGKQGVFGLDEENEDIRLHVLDAQAVFEAMYAGRTNNASTLIGLQWLQLHRHTLKPV